MGEDHTSYLYCGAIQVVFTNPGVPHPCSIPRGTHRYSVAEEVYARLTDLNCKVLTTDWSCVVEHDTGPCCTVFFIEERDPYKLFLGIMDTTMLPIYRRETEVTTAMSLWEKGKQLENAFRDLIREVTLDKPPKITHYIIGRLIRITDRIQFLETLSRLLASRDVSEHSPDYHYFPLITEIAMRAGISREEMADLYRKLHTNYLAAKELAK